MKNNVAFIFARGGSKEIINKNIQTINNIPLIAYSINIAKKSEIFDDIVISTDSDHIAKIASDYGIKTDDLRPEKLASDESPEWLSWQYEVKKYQKKSNFKTFFSIPCTSPLREVSDIINMKKFYDKNNFDLVLGVSKSEKSPFFNMVKKDINNSIDKVLLTDKSINRRQEAGDYFDITTVCYITSPDYILNSKSMLDGSLGGYEIPKERSLDIDTQYDLYLAELILNANNNRK